jgi:hypothetical protein
MLVDRYPPHQKNVPMSDADHKVLQLLQMREDNFAAVIVFCSSARV